MQCVCVLSKHDLSKLSPFVIFFVQYYRARYDSEGVRAPLKGLVENYPAVQVRTMNYSVFVWCQRCSCYIHVSECHGRMSCCTCCSNPIITIVCAWRVHAGVWARLQVWQDWCETCTWRWFSTHLLLSGRQRREKKCCDEKNWPLQSHDRRVSEQIHIRIMCFKLVCKEILLKIKTNFSVYLS